MWFQPEVPKFRQKWKSTKKDRKDIVNKHQCFNRLNLCVCRQALLLTFTDPRLEELPVVYGHDFSFFQWCLKVCEEPWCATSHCVTNNQMSKHLSGWGQSSLVHAWPCLGQWPPTSARGSLWVDEIEEKVISVQFVPCLSVTLIVSGDWTVDAQFIPCFTVYREACYNILYSVNARKMRERRVSECVQCVPRGLVLTEGRQTNRSFDLCVRAERSLKLLLAYA